MKFYDREQEINTIHEWIRLSEKRLQVGVIYGRRRVGKTRLINEAVRGHPFLYCFVERKPLSDLLSDFQEGLSAITDLFSGVTLESLIAFLNLLERLAERQPLVVVFDEFQNFRYIDPSVFSTFQKWIDANQDRTGLTIIFIGSVSSQGNKGQISYATTKAGLEGAAATMMKEAIFYGVRCGIIHPGFTDTPMAKQLGSEFLEKHVLPYTQLRRLIRTEEIADAICFMVSNSAVSGQLWADAGWHPPA